MKKQMKQCNEINKEKGFKRVVKFTKANWVSMIMIAFMMLHFNYAYGAGSDDMWSKFVDFICPWIYRAGGLLVVAGLIEYGYGHSKDEPDHKSRGQKMGLGGAIVFAVGVAAPSFLS